MLTNDKFISTLKPANLPNAVGYWLGIAVHILLCIFHRIKGYTSPGTSPQTDAKGAVEYNEKVVDGWLRYLDRYCGQPLSHKEASILELGPGPDLGAGLLLLAEGAASYTAIDVNPLIVRATSGFYNSMFEVIETRFGPQKVSTLRKEMREFSNHDSEIIRYICRSDFDIGIVGQGSIDLVFSQAAFEHFDDMDRTVEQLSYVMRKGGRCIIQIDLKTHTPKLRDLDPLNIYRIPNYIYQAASYPGMPNRLRPDNYKSIFEWYGFTDIQIIYTQLVDSEHVSQVRPYLDLAFRNSDMDMSALSMVLCATR